MTTSPRRRDLILGLVGVGSVVAFVPKLFWRESALYQDFLTEEVLVYSGSIVKLVFLLLSGLFAVRSARRLEEGNPARRPWALLGGGFLTFFLGQAILGFHVMVLRQPSPFPSGGDLFFLAAYPTLDFALLVPIMVLIRITSRFQGGRVAFVWTMLLTGGVCLCAGDIAFAYFSTMGKRGLDPLADVLFVLSYLFIARGTMAQYELLTS